MHTLPARLVVEFVGTMTLIAVGVGAILSVGSVSPADPLSALIVVALAHGLAIAVMIGAAGHVSGGFFNPAVTLGAYISRAITLRDAGAYWIAQLAGGTVGALLVKGMFPSTYGFSTAHGGTPALGPDVSVGMGIGLEAFMTFLLVWVVLGAGVDARDSIGKVAGMFIGLTITIDILMGGGLTGAAMNPARAFGPALVSGTWTNQLVWWVGPLLGAAVAGLLYSRVVNPAQGAKAAA